MRCGRIAWLGPARRAPWLATADAASRSLRWRLLGTSLGLLGTDAFDPLAQAGQGRLGRGRRRRPSPYRGRRSLNGGPPGGGVFDAEDQPPHRDVYGKEQDG